MITFLFQVEIIIKSKFILLTILSFSLVAFSKANNFKPLSDIINSLKVETSQDKMHMMSILSLRCGGYFGAMAAFIGKREIALISANLVSSTALAELNANPNNEMNKTIDWARDKIMNTKKKYQTIMEENNLNTGNYYTGSTFLDSEYNTCKNFVPIALKFIENNGVEILK